MIYGKVKEITFGDSDHLKIGDFSYMLKLSDPDDVRKLLDSANESETVNQFIYSLGCAIRDSSDYDEGIKKSKFFSLGSESYKNHSCRRVRMLHVKHDLELMCEEYQEQKMLDSFLKEQE